MSGREVLWWLRWVTAYAPLSLTLCPREHSSRMSQLPRCNPGPVSPIHTIQYAEQLSSVDLWLKKAEELLASATVLRAEVEQYWSEIVFRNGQIITTPDRTYVQPVYSMIVAYAIENYCKALLVFQHSGDLQNRVLRRLPRYLKSHDLTGLARRIGMSLSVPDEELLSRLTRNSEWAARYPVPTEPSATAAARKFSDGRQYLIAYLGPNDLNRIDEFVDRLAGFVREQMGA